MFARISTANEAQLMRSAIFLASLSGSTQIKATISSAATGAPAAVVRFHLTFESPMQ
jgi:hypothetical protein